MNLRFMRMTSRLLIVSVFSFGLPLQSANAEIMGTDKVAASIQSQNARDRIRTLLDREDVRNGFQARGVDVQTAKERVDALTDDEVSKIVGKLDPLPAGGDILGLLFTIFLVLLVTDILGLTKVYSFTRPIK